MLFAGLAVSAAIDLLSQLQLQPQDLSARGIIGPAGRPAFEVGDSGADRALPTNAPQTASSRGNSLSLDTLLSAQGEAQAVQRKKRSISVLLELLQASLNGNVARADVEGASSDGEASELFDKIDQNRDSSINTAELSAFLETYRRNSGMGTTGGRAVAVVV